MRALATGLVVGIVAQFSAQSYPPPFPRPGVTKLLDNPRVRVWSYGWGFGQDGPRHRHDRDAVTVWVVDGTPHAVFIPAGTVHTEEQVGVISSATVFELK